MVKKLAAQNILAVAGPFGCCGLKRRPNHGAALQREIAIKKLSRSDKLAVDRLGLARRQSLTP